MGYWWELCTSMIISTPGQRIRESDLQEILFLMLNYASRYLDILTLPQGYARKG